VSKGAIQATTGRRLNFTQASTTPEPRFQTPDWFPLQRATTFDTKHQETLLQEAWEGNLGHKHFDKQNINNENLNQDMPLYLIQDLNNLDMQEFEIDIDYWMNYFKFTYATEELTAYDEGIYPDEQRKPTGRHHKYNAKSNNTPVGIYSDSELVGEFFEGMF
jgi:hypothetical protein